MKIVELMQRLWWGRLAILLAILLTLPMAWLWFRASSTDRGPLVVFCAADARFAESILRDFEKRSGIPLSIRYQETHSPPLAEVVVAEKTAPQGDVFWNNDVLTMMDLQVCGVLQPYKGVGNARIPELFKAPDGSWTGFAARLRVIIYNTAKIGSTPPNLTALLPGSDLSRIAIARPLSGSALTHYAVLWREWGGGRIMAWRHQWQRDGVKELNNDAAVKDAVAAGTCYAGFVDSDDYFAARDDGRPVAMEVLELDDGKTIFIPDAVAIIRGARHVGAARKLVDFLLSEETELALANSQSRQIPLGPVSPDRLPADVRKLETWVPRSVDLSTLGPARAECLAWLKSESSP